MDSNGNDFLDLSQLTKVLTEIDEPRTNPLDDWGDLADILIEIKDNVELKDKLKEILRWINDNPTHTYPKRVKGWTNAIRAQFCPVRGQISAENVVDQLVRLEILTVVEYTTQVRRRVYSTNRVHLDRKRCRSEVVDDGFDQTPLTKRHKPADTDMN